MRIPNNIQLKQYEAEILDKSQVSTNRWEKRRHIRDTKRTNGSAIKYRVSDTTATISTAKAPTCDVRLSNENEK